MRKKPPEAGLHFSKLELGIVCPMANERKSVEPFVRDVLSICRQQSFYRVTFFPILDLVSTDGTLDILRYLEQKNAEIQIIFAPENRCVVDAYLRGYESAIQSGCDWILEMDAGYSHQPGDIPRFFQTMAQGYDCVFGSRFCRGGKFSNTDIRRYIISRGGTILANILLGAGISDMTGGFELFTRDALQWILKRGIRSRGPFFQTEIRWHAHHMQFAEIPIHYHSGNHPIRIGNISDAFSNLWRLRRLQKEER